jgi:hypothetical protein
MLAEVNNSQSPSTASSPTTQTISGLVFSPDACLYLNGFSGGDGSILNAGIGFGVGARQGDDVQVSFFSWVQNAVTTMDTGRCYTSTYCVNQAFDNAVHERFTAVSTADGETRTWATNNTSTYYHSMMALAEIGVHVGVLTVPNTTGSVTYYLPTDDMTGMMFFSSHNFTNEIYTEGNMIANVGFFDRTNVASRSVWSENGVADADCGRIGSTTAIVDVYFDNAQWLKGSITSISGNALTINWTTVPSTAHNLYYVAFSRCQCKTGTISAPAGTGTSATTGVGFTPKALILLHVGLTSEGSHSVDCVWSMGWASSTTKRASFSFTDDDAAATSICYTEYEGDEIISGLTIAGASDLAADLSSFDSDGFTLNYTTTTSGVKIAYLALGDEVSGSPRQGLHPIEVGAI